MILRPRSLRDLPIWCSDFYPWSLSFTWRIHRTVLDPRNGNMSPNDLKFTFRWYDECTLRCFVPASIENMLGSSMIPKYRGQRFTSYRTRSDPVIVAKLPWYSTLKSSSRSQTDVIHSWDDVHSKRPKLNEVFKAAQFVVNFKKSACLTSRLTLSDNYTKYRHSLHTSPWDSSNCPSSC
jgi:hypothetical protein